MHQETTTNATANLLCTTSNSNLPYKPYNFLRWQLPVHPSICNSHSILWVWCTLLECRFTTTLFYIHVGIRCPMQYVGSTSPTKSARNCSFQFREVVHHNCQTLLMCMSTIGMHIFQKIPPTTYLQLQHSCLVIMLPIAHTECTSLASFCYFSSLLLLLRQILCGPRDEGVVGRRGGGGDS